MGQDGQSHDGGPGRGHGERDLYRPLQAGGGHPGRGCVSGGKRIFGDHCQSVLRREGGGHASGGQPGPALPPSQRTLQDPGRTAHRHDLRGRFGRGNASQQQRQDTGLGGRQNLLHLAPHRPAALHRQADGDGVDPNHCGQHGDGGEDLRYLDGGQREE